MFKKLHTTKTSAPIKTSELRKLRLELTSLFNLSINSPLLKILLPDGLLAQKSLTHLDESLIIFSNPITLNPLFFRIGKINSPESGLLIPTIYGLDSILPNKLLPELITAKEVVEHLISGSALFSTGISDTSLLNLPDEMKQGDLVAITAQGSDIIVALGQLVESKQNLIKDRKGKAVITLHARGDHLYKSGSETIPSPLPSLTPSTSSLPPSTATSTSTSEEITSNLASTSLSSPPEASTSASTSASVELTPSEIDLILLTALLISIRTIATINNKDLFPMPASSLYSTYILPNRPSGIGSGVEIKKSSYKKLTGLMKEANKRNWIVIKEVKGELLVMSVNVEHKDVETVKGYRTVGMDEKARLKAIASGEGEGNSSSTSAGNNVTVIELYKPPSSFHELINLIVDSVRPPSDLYTSTSLQSILKQYITLQNLSHPRDQKFLKLDSILINLLGKKGEELENMSKDEASRRLLGICTNFWSLQKGSNEAIIRKGTPPKIKISIKTVGKRTVTLISNFELWELFSPESFAEELKIKAASSTSISPIAGNSPKKPFYEIMIQGTHENLVMKLLLLKGFTRNYIELDLSKKK